MRIGIVNDLPGMNKLLRRIVDLTPKHHVIWMAGSGAEAVELCVKETPDLILMDLVMPGMNGAETTRRIDDPGRSSERLSRRNCRRSTRGWTVRLRHGGLAGPGFGASRASGRRGRSADDRLGPGEVEPSMEREYDLADSTSLMAALKNAVERRDAPALRLATHSLKGTSSAVGANRMAAICEELEKLGRNTTFDGTPVSPVLSRADCVFGDGCLILGQPLGVQSGRIRSFAGTPVLDRALVDVLIS